MAQIKKNPSIKTASNSNENIYLLEFLIEDLVLNSKCECDKPPGQYCISFQFLNNEPIDMCEQDFDVNDKWNNSNTKIGKSVLFSLTLQQLQLALKQFCFNVDVAKKLLPGYQPPSETIGVSTIDATDLLKNVTSTDPFAKVQQDTYDLINPSTGKRTGRIAIYIRLSCYGKMIITQFQMNMKDKSVLFKDKNGQSLYRYKKSKKQKTKESRAGQINETFACKATCPEAHQKIYPNQQQMYAAPNLFCPTQSCFSQQVKPSDEILGCCNYGRN